MDFIFKPGVIDSPQDDRDYTVDTLNIDKATNLPDNYLAPYLPMVYDQSTYQMCVSFALSGIKEAQELKERGVRTRFSPAFIYANREDSNYQGEGMMPREALKMLCKYGTSKFDDFNLLGSYPVCKQQFISRIHELYPIGLPQRIKTYVHLFLADDIKTFLITEQTPILATIAVYDSFCKTDSTGIVGSNSGNFLGGHAVQIAGWKLINGKPYWIMINSWGINWGDKGYFYYSFDLQFNEVWGMTDMSPNEDINQPKQFCFKIGDPTVLVDNAIKILDSPPFIKDGRTFIPLRFFSEELGYKVDFLSNGGDQVVILSKGGEISN